MQKKIIIGFVGLAVLVGIAVAPFAQERGGAAGTFEYAIVKWDGPDRVYYNLPDRFEMMHLRAQGPAIPKDAQEEEFCLAYAANQMAKQGWEVVNLDSRRLVLRRVKR